MSSTLGLVQAALADTNPYLAPAALAVSGLTASWLAVRRRRLPPSTLRRPLIWSCIVLAFAAFGLAGALLARDAQLFWGAHWEGGKQALVLERLGPLPNVHLARGEVTAVTEFAAPEHILFGRQTSVQFAVHTRSGRVYWSSPLHGSSLAARARETLIAATDRRLERVWVGGRPRLP